MLLRAERIKRIKKRKKGKKKGSKEEKTMPYKITLLKKERKKERNGWLDYVENKKKEEKGR